LPLYLEKISIVNGRAIVDDSLKGSVKQEVVSTIQTETQAAIYQLYLEMKPTFDEMTDLLKKTNSKCDVFCLAPSNDALLYTDEEEHLEFCGELVNLVN
jgi:hypothetical protein